MADDEIWSVQEVGSNVDAGDVLSQREHLLVDLEHGLTILAGPLQTDSLPHVGKEPIRIYAPTVLRPIECDDLRAALPISELGGRIDVPEDSHAAGYPLASGDAGCEPLRVAV